MLHCRRSTGQIKPPLNRVVFEQFGVAAPVHGGGQLALGFLEGEVVVPDAEEEIGAHGAVFLLLQGVHDAAEHRHPAQGLESRVVGAQSPWNAF